MRSAIFLFAFLALTRATTCYAGQSISYTPPDSLDELQIQITSVDSMQLAVFHQRIYEIIVTPYDRYMNTIDEPVEVAFSARYQDEFRFDVPGCTDIFSSPQILHGVTVFYLISTKEREAGKDNLQLLSVHAGRNPFIEGYSDYYEIRSHAPAPFALTSPLNNTKILLLSSSTRQQFEWEQSSDPVYFSKVSRYSNDFLFDSIKYSIAFTDSASLTHTVRVPADNMGTMSKFSTTHSDLEGILSQLFGVIPLSATTIWYVDATDGIYNTKSMSPNSTPPSDGFYMRFELASFPFVEQLIATPSSFRLHQNHPNPFNPSTTIRFEIVERGHVTLRVIDLLGNQVAELANETLDPGVYSAEFNASGLASGVYTYILQTGIAVLTRQMIVEK